MAKAKRERYWTVSFCVDGGLTGKLWLKTQSQQVSKHAVRKALAKGRLGETGSTIHFTVWQEWEGQTKFLFEGRYRVPEKGETPHD